MPELKLPTIKPSTPHIIVNASGEDWRSWGNVVMSAVSVKANSLVGYIGADTHQRMRLEPFGSSSKLIVLQKMPKDGDEEETYALHLDTCICGLVFH